MSIVAESNWEFKHQEYNIDAYIQTHDSVKSWWVDASPQKCIDSASSNTEMLLQGCLDFCPVWASLCLAPAKN